ncbi:uncharacterized protein At4g00950-like [Cornus florida]|uniref:uncharacterized protein At4g00950-like n=1 Tax=Cornus florida TaxID=4283 RepID=UPI002899C4BD|nr:uncharacterized protein At4g00950-like [Cornus florida]
MGSETERDPSSTPKLSFNSLPSKQFESPGMPTPPFHALASVPFSWEDEPGKPRPSTTTATATAAAPPKSKRSLELPPRLLTDQVKVTNTSSPTTVLEGPYPGRSLSHTLSFSFGKRSFRSPDGGLQAGDGKREMSKERWNLSSCRWGSFKENSTEVVFGASFDFSDSANVFETDRTKVKITRVRRRNSFFSFSHTHSNLWASIYGSFKQAVPWRRNQEKQRKQRSL